jgi:hypothetical protein
MNTYDPADRIRYVHLSGPAGTRSAATHPAPTHSTTPDPATPDPAATDRGTACAPLPSGYANQSPRTRLHRHPAPARRTPATVVPLTA